MQKIFLLFLFTRLITIACNDGQQPAAGGADRSGISTTNTAGIVTVTATKRMQPPGPMPNTVWITTGAEGELS